MTTELNKLQIENPPKKDKNDGGELIHGKGLTKMACPEEIKGPGHAATEAMMVKNEGKKAGERDGSNMQAGEVGEGVGRSQRSEAEAQEFFGGKDCAAQGQRGLLRDSNWNYNLMMRHIWKSC